MNKITEVTENIRNSIKVLREKVIKSEHGNYSNGKCQNWCDVSPIPEEKRRYILSFNEFTVLKCLICFSSIIGLCKIIIASNRSGWSKNYQLLDLVTVPAAAITFISNVIVAFSWLLIPAIIGIGTTFVTWFIVYHDSRIPGVDPPSPFSPRLKTKILPLKLSYDYLFALSIGFIVFLVLLFSGMFLST